MSTTEYVLQTQNPDGPKQWFEHHGHLVRIRRVLPDCETLWEAEATEFARLFAELLTNAQAECQQQLNKIAEEFIDGMEGD